MKIAILLEKNNFEYYAAADQLPPDFELLQFGNNHVDLDALAESGAEVIVCDPMVPVTADLIARMPNLKLIQSQGVGYNLFDLEAARARGIDVANCAGANSGAVAEQAVLLMLAVLRNVKEFDRMVYDAKQSEAKQMCFKNGIVELSDCHVGILGLGAIGRTVAKILTAFGSRVSYYDPFPKADCPYELKSMDEIFRECDIISLHLPVTPETINLVNDDVLNSMKPGSILINTSRGEIVDQEALVRAIISGKLKGAGIDTLSPEPVTADNPLLTMPAEYRDRVVLSPHIGGISEGSFRRYFRIIWENVARVSRGEKPKNVVN